jgi:hypothetical protein
LLLIFLVSNAKAGKIENGFQALHIYDYFKAKKLFQKLIKKENAAAAYGLATIYRRNDNPFHQLDSALKYSALANAFYAKNKKVFTYQSFKVDSSSIKLLSDSIANEYLKKIEPQNKTQLLEHFLLQTPHVNSQIRNAAFQLRDELVLEKMLRLHHPDSSAAILNQYPQLYLLKEARLVYDRQLYEALTSEANENVYWNYLAHHETSSQATKAIEALFAIYTKNKDKSGLSKFVNKFPNAPQTPESWKLLFALSVKSYSNEELQDFLSAFPAFPYKTSILKEIELNNYILLPIEQGELQGFIDTASKIVISPQFDKVNPFHEGLAVVAKDDKTFYINKESQNAFGNYFTEAYDFHNGIAAVQYDSLGNWRFINRQGQFISDTYDEISDLSNDMYVVKKSGKYGAMNRYAQLIIEPKFSKIGDYKNDLAYYEENGLFGFINKEGSFTKPQFQWISNFNEYGVAVIQLENKYGLVNRFNQTILAPLYDQIVNAGKNIFIAVKNGKYGFYSGKGCFLSALEYDYKKEKPAEYYTNGQLLRFIKKDEQAFADGNGRISIDFGTYEDLSFAGNGLIRVKRKNKFGYVNRKLSPVIPYKYSDANDFKDSIAIVKRKDKSYLINVSGTELLETEGTISPLAPKLFLLEKPEGMELINEKTQLLFKNMERVKKQEDGYLILYFKDNSIKVLKY